MKELIFRNDPYQMNWLRQDFEYAKVTAPKELICQVRNRRKGDCIYTEIQITNQTEKPYFTRKDSLEIAFPLADKYEDSRTCLTRRCHTHIFCGKNTSYICAVRMGGENPHLGMILTEGSLVGYSIQRNILDQSNDRGCFLLHPEAMEFSPGECKKISWIIFPHQGKSDFIEKCRQYHPQFVEVSADRYVLFPKEKNRIHIRLAFDAKEVLVNGCKAKKIEDGYAVEYIAEQPGEQIFKISVDGQETFCRCFVHEMPDNLAEKRCHFIMEHQQYNGKITQLQGAYLAYDNEEEILVYTPENDFNGGRERVGMGVLISEYLQYLLQQGKDTDQELQKSLETYTDYVMRELTNPEIGNVYNDCGRDDSYKRLYNMPWVATFFVELYQQKKEIMYLTYACHIIERFYEEGGLSFYPIELPMVSLVQTLESAQMTEEAERMRVLFVQHADMLCEIGIDYPASEVNYEQSIVAPAADVILSAYLLTGDIKYLEEGERQVKILELFNGIQPDYHLYETAVRHWDGYWFGKRRYYGDTFPHYWSALTGNVFEKYGQITGNKKYLKRAEDSRRGVLPMIFGDGRASCAYVYPNRVNGREAGFYDPYANDQDWGLYFYLRYLNEKRDN